MILKKQEILLKKIITIFRPNRYDDVNKKSYFINEVTLNSKTIFIREEKLRLEKAIHIFLEKNQNDAKTELQQKFFEVFEKVIE